jgi:hypothetical protein
MAQLDFYLSRQDKIELVEFLFAKGAKLIPSVDYPTEGYIELHTHIEYEEYVDKNVLMHIIHPSYTSIKLQMDFFEKRGKKVFYICQRHGGPTIDFYSPGKIVEDGINFIGPGFISTYSYHWIKGEKTPIGSELKSFYKDACNFIKSRSARLKNVKREYHVGVGTIRGISNGYKLVSISDEALEKLKTISA